MRKYLVIDQEEHGDMWEDIFDTLDEANAAAESDWRYLTRNERKNRRIFVAHIEDTEDYLNSSAFDEDGSVDFHDWHSCDTEENYFDSDKQAMEEIN